MNSNRITWVNVREVEAGTEVSAFDGEKMSRGTFNGIHGDTFSVSFYSGLYKRFGVRFHEKVAIPVS